MTTMYGIANCDTIKKAKKWLTQHNIDFTFHDYKKLGVDAAVLQQAITDTSLEQVLNKRGTTYRKLSDDVKNSINEENAVDILSEHSSMIKRPLLVSEKGTLLGFKEAQYKEFFNID